jgi:hypothetical protein
MIWILPPHNECERIPDCADLESVNVLNKLRVTLSADSVLARIE